MADLNCRLIQECTLIILSVCNEIVKFSLFFDTKNHRLRIESLFCLKILRNVREFRSSRPFTNFKIISKLDPGTNKPITNLLYDLNSLRWSGFSRHLTFPRK